jgi:hypothetical protein
MRRSFVPALILVATTTTSAWSQNPAGKEAARLAEVRFADGSIVRMVIQQESLEVMTKYGKLTIPTNDIRKIEMGRHPPEGIERTIDQSIKLLSSEAFKQREDASRDLLQAGHWAYPALQKATGSPEMEVAKRAQTLLHQIAEKTNPEVLKLKIDDVITTTEFPVHGRIVSSTIKAYSPLFGEQALKLSDLRSLHLRGVRGEVELAIDSAKYGEQWYDTGVILDSQLRLIVTADGQADLWPQTPGQYMAHPRGYNTPGKGGTYLAGALIGKIGENGRSFLVGDRYEGSPTEEGKLYLQIVASPWNNASTGSYRVRIATEHVALTGR